MPRTPRNPGSGKLPHNGPARGRGHGGPASGAGHGGSASGGGYGGQAQGYSSGLRRAAPITADTARELAALAMTDDAVARRAAREEITARLLGDRSNTPWTACPMGPGR